jgi:dynein heavy chain
MTEKELKERVNKLIDSITVCSFNYVRRGLFERHKIIFSTFICLRIMERGGRLKAEEIKLFVEGRPHMAQLNMPETVRGYLTEPIWRECKSLESVPEMADLCESLDHDHLHWRKWFGEEKVEEIDLPKKYKDARDFHKLMIIKVMRPDRVSSALKIFVASSIGTHLRGQPPVRHGRGLRGEFQQHPPCSSCCSQASTPPRTSRKSAEPRASRSVPGR